MQEGSLKDDATMRNLNLSSCGVMIHPYVPWLEASLDGLVYDHLERPKCGLGEIKCPNAQSFVNRGQQKLKEGHSYYWQIQEQLLLTGMKWCNVIVYANNDMLVQQIYRDDEVVSKR